MSDILEEASSAIQDLISQSLTRLLESKVQGQLEEYPAVSCLQLATRSSPLRSGYYWVRGTNGTSVSVYCDLTTGFDDAGEAGFMRVANLDMSEVVSVCPPSLAPVSYCGSLCGRGTSSPGCSSVFYSTFGLPYRKVCGSVIGYQYSSPNAFFAHQLNPNITIDEAYLDGVSLTYGSSPRHHIWSFAAALDESSSSHSICPCTNPDHTLPQHAVPHFLEGHYFCETGNRDHYQSGRPICNDPLWDGKGCGLKSNCCHNQSNSSWFCVDLGLITTHPLELRLCGNEATSNEDTPLESIQLYVQ